MGRRGLPWLLLPRLLRTVAAGGVPDILWQLVPSHRLPPTIPEMTKRRTSATTPIWMSSRGPPHRAWADASSAGSGPLSDCLAASLWYSHVAAQVKRAAAARASVAHTAVHCEAQALAPRPCVSSGVRLPSTMAGLVRGAGGGCSEPARPIPGLYSAATLCGAGPILSCYRSATHLILCGAPGSVHSRLGRTRDFPATEPNSRAPRLQRSPM
jgi:hypothetical protein